MFKTATIALSAFAIIFSFMVSTEKGNTMIDNNPASFLKKNFAATAGFQSSCMYTGF